MTAIIEQNNLGDLLKYEMPNLYSREEVTAVRGENLALGTVVGRDSETKFIRKLDPTANTGAQTAIGAVIMPQDIKSNKAVIATRIAILADHAIIWPVNITEEQKQSTIFWTPEILEAIGFITIEQKEKADQKFNYNINDY